MSWGKLFSAPGTGLARGEAQWVDPQLLVLPSPWTPSSDIHPILGQAHWSHQLPAPLTVTDNDHDPVYKKVKVAHLTIHKGGGRKGKKNKEASTY